MWMVLSVILAAHAAEPPGTAGFSKRGFGIEDASGENSLYLGMSFQSRFTESWATHPATDADAVGDVGFRVRRMLLTANGTVARDFEYRFRIDVAKAFVAPDGNGKDQLGERPILDDAQVVWHISDPLQIAVGQWKVPFTASMLAGDSSLIAVERPLAIDGLRLGSTSVPGFSWGRDAGVAVLGAIAAERLEYQVGVFNGDGINQWPPTDEGLLYTARVAVSPLGAVRYDELDLQRSAPGFQVAADVGLDRSPVFDDAGASAGVDDALRVGGELRFVARGLSVQGEALYGRTESGAEVTPSVGAYAQAGYVLEPGIAPAVRWSRLQVGDDPAYDALDGIVTFFLPAGDHKNLGRKGEIELDWNTLLRDGEPVQHQLTAALLVGF